MAIHNQITEWHDVTEDPKDFPNDLNTYKIVLWDPDPTSRNEYWVFFTPIEVAGVYLPNKHVWVLSDDDAEAVGHKEFGIDTEPVRVIAWAEITHPYCPRIIEEKHKEKFGKSIHDVYEEESRMFARGCAD